MSARLRFDHGILLAAVERELSISPSIRERRKLVESDDRRESQHWYLDEVLRDRADKSLEHIFNLLAVQLPVEPLKVAFRGLHTSDRILLGLALEFLESQLPAALVLQMRNLAEPAQAVERPLAALATGNQACSARSRVAARMAPWRRP